MREKYNRYFPIDRRRGLFYHAHLTEEVLLRLLVFQQADSRELAQLVFGKRSY